jgi:hypothetical protein
MERKGNTHMRRNTNYGILTLGLIFCLAFLVLFTGRVVKGIMYDQQCGGYLKRAADANTIEMARTELGRAIQYLEENNMTSGYTSIIYTTPNEDVGFWYKNLVASRAELDKVLQNKNTSQLEASNLLIKLRETLIDHDKEGQRVTRPNGIAVFPNNVGWAVGLSITAVLGLIGVGIINDVRNPN